MEVNQIKSGFEKLRIAVMGDVMIDAYLVGRVTRISPEAPVPVVNLRQEENRLGGAANVALNLIALGVQTEMISVVGNDNAGQELCELLQKRNIGDGGIVRSANRKTTIKTRVIGNNQHLLRIDNEQTDAVSKNEENEVKQRLDVLLKNGLDALILEDYNKGVLTHDLIEWTIRRCRESGVKVTVDPKKEQFFSYRGVDLFKPNLKELKEGLNREIDPLSDQSLHEAITALEEKLQHQRTLLTLSEHGMLLKSPLKTTRVRAHRRDIADVSGAGDTVIAVATACLALDLPEETVVEMANLAGGLVCESVGVVAVNCDQLMREMKQLNHGH